MLAIALLPVVLSALQSQRQIEHMAAAIAATTRTQELERERHYLREKVADIGTGLRLVGSLTEELLARQVAVLESALANPASGSGRELLASRTLADTDAERASFLVADPSCGTACNAAISQLAAASDELKAIRRAADPFSLWHYAGLENGVHMVFPAHGGYPEKFDPRERPWYRAATTGGRRWLPLTIDASTRQPVLTIAAPLRDSNGRSIGASAIDLPLNRLLSFQSETAPWLNVAQLSLLRLAPGGELRVIARQQAIEADSDWRSAEQTATLEGLNEGELEQLRKLQRGQSLLFEEVTLGGETWNLAFTAMGNAGDNWLALFSPHSATEAAVEAALLPILEAQAVSMRQHLMVALALAITVALIAMYAARRVTTPLIRMSHTAENLAAGKLESRTGLKRTDEVGVLSASIDRMADSIEQLQLEQEQAYKDMIMSLHRALEKKDAYTAGHSGRVTRTSLKLGQRIGLEPELLEILRFGALTHDLGKIGIADAILNKPAPLEGREVDIMRQHPGFSKTIMKPLVRFREYAEIAGSHHEHWDGSGYPEGLKGEEIHLLARIVAIADAWDSMIGDRVYRKGMPVADALAILEAEQDSGQFDPRLIREFIEMIRQEHPADGAAVVN
jgi:HD-GYP domain-containing protein (c-di-GMP phosphodiesterase class II)